jgi:hypothetical protein
VQLLTVSGLCGPLQSDLAAAWTEASGTWAGASIGLLGIIFVIKTWNSTRAQLQAARDQVSAAEAQLQIERQRNEEQEDALKRSQADRVAGWIITGEGVNASLHDIYVVNTSNQPVYNLSVSLQADQSTWKRKELPVLPPLLPGQQPRPLFGLDPADVTRLHEARDNGQPWGVCYTFRDTQNRSWTRRSDGRLVNGPGHYVDPR